MPKSKRTKGDKAKTKAVVHPRATDILFGRGGHVNHHKANQYYLELVSDRKEQYQNCKKVDKASIAWDIIRELQDQSPSPRFLKKDYSTGLWHTVNENEVRRKISQCLRERAVPVLPKKNKAKAKKAAKSKLLEQQGSFGGKDMGKFTACTETDLEEDSPSDKRTKQREISEGLFEIFAKQDTVSEAKGSTTQNDPFPTLACTPHRQESFQPDRNNAPASQETEEVCFAPPMPTPVPITQPTRLGESARAWSDFLTGSFASFTPSIFDASGVENAWENLLDPSTLPQLCNNDDDESFPGSLTSDETSVECVRNSKQNQTMKTLPSSTSQAEKCMCSPAGLTPISNDYKTQSDMDTSETPDVEPISVDSFFRCDVMNLGKVLENSRLNSYAATL